MSRLYKISRAERNSANVELKELTWDKIAKVLSQHKVGEDKESRGNFVGGWFKDNYRNKENMLKRSLLTLDVDHYSGDLDDLEFDLSLLPFSYVVYSTWRSRPGDLRFRIVIPLTHDIDAENYPALCRSFADKFKQFQFDLSGYKPEQFMYMPCVSSDSEPFSFIGDDGCGIELDPDSFNLEQFKDDFDANRIETVDNDFELMIAQQPLDISSDEIEAYLMMYPASDLDYDAWLKVGSALHHQFRGDEEGYMHWLRWSEKSVKHDESLMPMKYKSFGKTKTKPVTFASIKWMVDGGSVGGTVGGSSELQVVNRSVVLDDLKEQAKAITDDTSYLALSNKLSRLNLAIVSETQRQQLSVLIWDSWGKSVGMTKGAIKKELMPPKRNRTAGLDDAPEWVDGWVYVESVCEFYNIDLHYGIKREAFNAKFDRENECVMADKPASVMALTVWHIPTVVGCMFWPGAAEMFEYEGKRMLNSYRESGVRPWDGRVDGVEGGIEGGMGVENDPVIAAFLAHLKFMIEDEREREIVLDWMTWIIQNPGSRVNWALLIQGTQGSGKSFLANVLQWVLGINVRMLDPTAISGRFTAWAQGALVNVVEEIRISGENRWAIVDRMKPFISNTTVLIEEKGRDHRTVPNFTSYLMLTNHKDAIPLVKDDRRYCVIYGRIQSEEQLYAELGGAKGVEDYFTRLFDECEKGADKLSFFFRTRQIVSPFSSKGRAPQTKARLEMIDYAVSDEHVRLLDAIERHRCDVINERIVDATYFKHLCERDGEQAIHPKKMMHFLLEMGYRKLIKRVRIKSKNLNQSVWMRNTVPSENFTVPEEEIEKIVKSFHENLILEYF